jgi:Na+-driven multidrug efflux pump
VAWATVIGEASVAIAAFFWVRSRFELTAAPSWARVLDRAAFMRLVAVNRDIMIRSLALLAGFFLFTRYGAQFGEVTLAANAILLNFFLLAAYFLDGLAAASEQLAGRALGAQARGAFWAVVRKASGFGFAISIVAAMGVLILGGHAVDVMTTADNVRVEAREFLLWAALTAPLGVLAFQMDGIYIGATWSETMRNMMLVSLAILIALSTALIPLMGNDGLWLAFNGWLAARGLSLLIILPQRVGAAFPPSNQ